MQNLVLQVAATDKLLEVCEYFIPMSKPSLLRVRGKCFWYFRNKLNAPFALEVKLLMCFLKLSPSSSSTPR